MASPVEKSLTFHDPHVAQHRQHSGHGHLGQARKPCTAGVIATDATWVSYGCWAAMRSRECHHFVQQGWCRFGADCRYEHPAHVEPRVSMDRQLERGCRLELRPAALAIPLPRAGSPPAAPRRLDPATQAPGAASGRPRGQPVHHGQFDPGRLGAAAGRPRLCAPAAGRARQLLPPSAGTTPCGWTPTPSSATCLPWWQGRWPAWRSGCCKVLLPPAQPRCPALRMCWRRQPRELYHDLMLRLLCFCCWRQGRWQRAQSPRAPPPELLAGWWCAESTAAAGQDPHAGPCCAGHPPHGLGAGHPAAGLGGG